MYTGRALPVFMPLTFNYWLTFFLSLFSERINNGNIAKQNVGNYELENSLRYEVEICLIVSCTLARCNIKIGC